MSEADAGERARIALENSRRSRERYAPWQPAEIFMRQGRSRRAIALLRAAGLFPIEGRKILEVGCGEGGWLPELLGWRLAAGDLHGVDLDAARIAVARRRLPGCHLALADAAALPYADGSFALVVASTVFSSILDPEKQRAVAREIVRVLRPGGALLFYDFAVDSPGNDQVRGVPTRRLRALFPALRGKVVRATLAPPIVRLLAPRSMTLAALAESVPWLRTHRLALLVRSEANPSG